MAVEAFDPDDIMMALTRLREAIDRADDEASAHGNVRPETGRELALRGADVYVISKRLRPEHR